MNTPRTSLSLAGRVFGREYIRVLAGGQPIFCPFQGPNEFSQHWLSSGDGVGWG
jgi:hypothetical protein